MYSEFSGNHRIYLRNKILPSSILHDSVVNDHSTPQIVFNNHRKFYDLLRSLNNIKTEGDCLPERDLYALIHTGLEFNSALDVEAYEHYAQKRKRGLAVSLVRSGGDINDKTKPMWIFQSEMQLIESFSYKAASADDVTNLEFKHGEWRTLGVMNGHAGNSDKDYLAFFINNKTYGIIRTENDPIALIYS